MTHQVMQDVLEKWNMGGIDDDLDLVEKTEGKGVKANRPVINNKMKQSSSWQGRRQRLQQKLLERKNRHDDTTCLFIGEWQK